ncbi:MAG: hypothetical protein U0231_14515 [Nitrospiraceae bacterium]
MRKREAPARTDASKPPNVILFFIEGLIGGFSGNPHVDQTHGRMF